jgi:dTDP-4-amino-4,6-dideoxygalactose transaminase
LIPFNKPYLTGKEFEYLEQALKTGKISGNGLFTKKCQEFLCQRFNISKSLLTTSCTDALEMAAILLDIKEGDEIIMPSYTFVSTANAFILRGAKIVFCDNYASHPNINPDYIPELITDKTKAIIVVHYAGIACDMDRIQEIAKQNNLFVIEDAAQAIDSYYKGNALGSIGDLATFSFHETKNIISGEGGSLLINNKSFEERAEIIWEKGTNRSAFFRGEIDKYGWVDIGSSFLPSELISSFLYAQLEKLDEIQEKRKSIWNNYFNAFSDLEKRNIVSLPYIPYYSSNNAHMFYLTCKSKKQRDQLIEHLKNDGIQAVFHYIPLHSSSFFKNKHDSRILKNCDKFSNCLVRLPLFYELENQKDIIDSVQRFCK